MDLEKYIGLATRTESHLKNLEVNPQLVVNLLALFTASGRMLDQLKKHTFYNKEYDVDQFNGDYQMLVTTLHHLTHKSFQLNGTSKDMGEEPIKEVNPRLFHAIIGIATESTELCEALYDIMTRRKEVDLINLREEIGDISWYIAVFFDTLKELGCEEKWEETLVKNIAKLKKRYPEKFTSEKAINRDTESERKILEED